jgi:hypothetical protein
MVLSFATSPVHADLFVSNFTALNGTSGASGVWRNQTAATDLTIPVQLSQTGGTVKPPGGSAESRIDNSFPWQPLPIFAGGANAFSPNFDGDYINIETPEGGTTTVTLEFNALITNPVISLTDVEYRTTLSFPSTFTVLASTSNLSTTATTLTSNRSLAANDSFGVFGDEAACSIRFTGTFERIVFTVQVAVGDAGVGSNDRTGYVVSTMTAPVPLPSAPPALKIEKTGSQVMLSWPIGAFTRIEMSAPSALSGWMPIPGLDPSSTTTWNVDPVTLGSSRFFRGVRPP